MENQNNKNKQENEENPMKSFEDRLNDFSLHDDSLLGLLRFLRGCSEAEILHSRGPDAFFFVKFYQIGLKIFSFCCVLAVSILFPLHFSLGDSNSSFFTPGHSFSPLIFEDLSIFSISSIEAGSKLLYLHCVCAYLIHIAALWLFSRHSADFLCFRHSSLMARQTSGALRTIFIQNIPYKFQRAKQDNQRLLWEYFNSYYPNEVESVAIVRETKEIRPFLKERQKIKEKLEEAYREFIIHNHGQKRPTFWYFPLFSSSFHFLDRFCCFPWLARRLDFIHYLSKKFHLLNKKIRKLQEKAKQSKTLPNAFVTFKSSRAVNSAVRVEQNSRPFEFSACLSPESSDVYWPNVGLSMKSQAIRSSLVILLISLLLIFWSLPTTFAQSLSNLRRLARSFPVLRPLVAINPIILALVEGYLPGLTITLLMAVLPDLLLKLAAFQGLAAFSWHHMSTLNHYFLFQMINFFAVPIVAGSLFREFQLILQRPMEFFFLLGEGIPAAANFFLSYLLIRAFTGFPFQWLQINRLLPFLWKRWVFPGKSSPPTVKPAIFPYFTEIPESLLIFLIGLNYSIICPLLLPFVLLYFLLGYYSSLYSVLFLWNVEDYRTDGLFWLKLADQGVFCMFIAQFTLIGLFLLKNAPGPALFLLPLVAGTGIFYWIMKKNYQNKGEFLSVEEAETVDRMRKEREMEGNNEEKNMEHRYLQPELRDLADDQPEIPQEWLEIEEKSRKRAEEFDEENIFAYPAESPSASYANDAADDGGGVSSPLLGFSDRVVYSTASAGEFDDDDEKIFR